MTTFAKRLDELMYEFRYNKTQLAKRLGLSPATVHRWFSRDSMPGYETIEQIAALFKVDERYLRGAIDTPVPNDATPEEPEVFEQKENELDEELVRIIKSLNPQQIQRLKDFLAGLRG